MVQSLALLTHGNKVGRDLSVQSLYVLFACVFSHSPKAYKLGLF